LKERAFDCEEEKDAGHKNAELNADESRRRSQSEIVSRTELHHEMDHEFLNEVGAVGDARDKGGPGNSSTTKHRTRTHGADEKRGHAKSYERELPDAHDYRDFVRLTQIQAISYRAQGG